MKVYHGSAVKVTKPDLLHTRTNIDFGPGFYLTKDKGMATKWAADKAVSVVNEYELNLDGLNVIKLGLTKQWLDFVSYNRGFSNIEFDTTNIDVIIGPTADDKLFKTLETYFEKTITAEQAIKYLNIAGYSNQIVLVSDKALSQLNYISCKTSNQTEKQKAKQESQYERIVASTALAKMMELDFEQKQRQIISLENDKEENDYDDMGR